MFTSACETEELVAEVEHKVDGKGGMEFEDVSYEFRESILDAFNIDESIEFSPRDGYILSALIPSLDGSKLIVSEWADSMSNPILSRWQWSYHISLLDLETGDLEPLFENEPESAFKLIPVAYAGGCSAAHLPIAWNQNETGVILNSVMPNSCGTDGGTSPNGYHHLLIESKELFHLTNNRAEFSENHPVMLTTIYKESTLDICTPFLPYSNSLTITNIFSLESEVILDQEDTHYSIASLSADNILSYVESEFITDEEDACYSGVTNSVDKELDLNEILSHPL
jgi:hypothetical protein